MTPIKKFDTRVEADLARIALRGEGISAMVVGVDVALSGGAQGVQLLVDDDQVDAAREILEKSQPGSDEAKR